jgi:GNAT superfamily N-acetyltransferase
VRVTVEQFQKAHLEGAAMLLVETLGTRGHATGLRYTVSDIASARAVIADAVDTGPAVAALDDAAVVGFMIAPLPNVPGTGGSRMTIVHHAARSAVARGAYRLMYEQIAGDLVAGGSFEHSILVPTDQQTAVTALFELRFGIKQVKGVRPLTREVDTTTDEAKIRVARIEDLDRLVELSIELEQFHARSPMLRPALLNVTSIRSSLSEHIHAGHDAVLVASDGENLVGMIQAQPDRLYVDTVTIGMNIVTQRARSAGVGTTMLNTLCGWATESGFEHCAVGWDPANLLSDAFYRSKGFTPVRYELSRNIDSRVVWANENLDYGRSTLQ